MGSVSADIQSADEAAAQDSSLENTEIERSKVGIMRALVQREDPSAKEVDDLMIRRFLRARDLDIEKGSSLLLKYLKWKREFVPNGSISASEIPNDLAQNKLFMQGVDKMGRPIVVGFGSRHLPSKGSLEEFKRNAITLKLCDKCQADRKNSFVLETLRDGDTLTAMFEDTWHLYQSYRIVTQRG
ncbi:hypothetical protein ACSBR1_037097 [Camellia fascicularis]